MLQFFRGPRRLVPSQAILPRILSIKQYTISLRPSVELVPAKPAQVADALELAAPKKRTSLHKRRIRNAGQRMVKRKWDYVRYRTCMNCGAAARPHFLCPNCKKLEY